MVRSSVEETLNALLDAEADEICRRKAAETEHFPPTVSLQYHFNPNGNLRPYVGAGVNYTLFFSAKTRGALADSKLELDPSFGLAAQAGLRARGGGVHPRFGTANSRPALGQAFRKRRDCGAGLRQARRWKFRRRIRAESERQNISLLADDAVAALKRLSAHGALKSTPLGFAASAKPGGSRRWQRREPSLRRSSCSEADRSTRSSEEDIYSKYTADADKDSVPSFEEALRSRKQKYVWPDFLGRDTDSSEDLERLSIPGLWIFSDNDAGIPVDISIEGLNALRRKGHRYDYVLFSGLGHNNMDRTFHVATDWIERTS